MNVENVNNEQNDSLNADIVIRLDKSIKLIKSYIKDLSEASKYLKKEDKKGVIGAGARRNIVTIKLAYLYHVLDKLKEIKSNEIRTNHPVVIKSVNGSIKDISNKDILSLVKHINKEVHDTIFGIPKNIIDDALNYTKCGGCSKDGKLALSPYVDLVLAPIISVTCRNCGAKSVIEFETNSKE